MWDLDASGVPHLLRPDYFTQVSGQPVHFTHDYYRVFNNRFAGVIDRAHPGTLIFVEAEAGVPPYERGEQDFKDIVYAPHWYDAFVLVKKEYVSFIGANSHTRRVVLSPFIRRSYKKQLASLKGYADHQLGGVPFVLGEFGIPFDLHEKRAYQTGDFHIQEKALQRSMKAVEDNLLDYTLWNYTPDNTNLHGDLWNDEDLSIYSADQRSDPRDINSGGRGLKCVVRPYPMRTSGELLQLSFNPFKRLFKLKLRHDPAISDPTEVYVPNYQYPHGYSIKVSDGRYEIKHSQQLLLYWPGVGQAEHHLTIKP